jgi:hypothetical protein
MSHSTVLVIGEDPESMLIPYDENTEVEPHRSYVETSQPQDHWLFETLVKEHGLDPDTADWPTFVTAYNARYEEDGKLYYDPEMDRVYDISTYNPLSRWDWYQLGGRWTGFFKLKPGAQGETGSPGLMTPVSRVGWADQARKRDIDFEGMRDDAGAQAAEFHATAMKVLDGLPPMIPWAKVRDEMFPDDVKAARDYYHAQPGIQALYKAKVYVNDPVEHLCLDHPDPLLEHVTQARMNAVLTFAILDQDGWHERGKMGWWGVVHDESSPDAWTVVANSIIDKAPDDALFSVYDVHI